MGGPSEGTHTVDEVLEFEGLKHLDKVKILALRVGQSYNMVRVFESLKVTRVE